MTHLECAQCHHVADHGSVMFAMMPGIDGREWFLCGTCMREPVAVPIRQTRNDRRKKR
jgi:hypothetical protein